MPFIHHIPNIRCRSPAVDAAVDAVVTLQEHLSTHSLFLAMLSPLNLPPPPRPIPCYSLLSILSMSLCHLQALTHPLLPLLQTQPAPQPLPPARTPSNNPHPTLLSLTLSPQPFLPPSTWTHTTIHFSQYSSSHPQFTIPKLLFSPLLPDIITSICNAML